ncbi:MAG: HNH endonuclease [Anaerolineales bacterium]|nr:HNH endonuclease [Anaerolineales bacterium]
MRITKQASGGRGEYELADDAPDGTKPADLLDLSMKVVVGKHVIDTQIHIPRDEDERQGKYRLRRIKRNGGYPQVSLQMASILLLPRPIRDEAKAGAGEPVFQNNSYLIKNISIQDVRSRDTTSFTVTIDLVEGNNNTIAADEIPVDKRMRTIEALWDSLDKLPASISELLRKHRAYVVSGKPMPNAATSLVEELQKEVARNCADYEVSYSDQTDPLPALQEMLRSVATDRPPAIEQIEPEAIELKKRVQEKWLYYAAHRGPASIRFRKAVMAAYEHTCVACGSRFPKTRITNQSGIDAAHILPWSEYDLDKVSNGLALCRLHHWAFDQRILQVTFRNGIYSIELSAPALAQLTEPKFSITVLKLVVGQIPLSRLPKSEKDRPDPRLLQRLVDEAV